MYDNNFFLLAYRKNYHILSIIYITNVRCIYTNEKRSDRLLSKNEYTPNNKIS